MPSAQEIAQEIVARYSEAISAYEFHSINVQTHLRKPVEAVTLFIYSEYSAFSCHTRSRSGSDASISGPKPPPRPLPTGEEKKGSDWRDYMAQEAGRGGIDGLPNLSKVNQNDFEALGRRKKARLEAFLAGISLSVAGTTATPSDQDTIVKNVKGPQTTAMHTSPMLRPTSNMTKRLPQITAHELTLRLELYIRSLYRSKSQNQDCVLAAEPVRALRARARSIVVAFVDTVDTVQEQSPVLNRLLRCLTLELLAVQVLSYDLNNLIRRLCSDYVQKCSFASLAFLSSPENSADSLLIPMILKYLKYLQSNWKNCVSDCEMERMLTLTLDKDMRFTFKNIEFRSIGHLLEVCQGYRHELTHIEVSPDMRVLEERVNDTESLRQALRDLQREVITVNGNVLPPVKSRKDLVSLLSQVLNSRTLTSFPVKIGRNKKKERHNKHEEVQSEGEFTSGVSGDDSISSIASLIGAAIKETPAGTERRRRRNFRLSTVDFLTKRLLLAASRTGTGGDAYFIVRDLFGGENVEVVPSHFVAAMGHPMRSGSVEIVVRLASITIKCHGSFDVYPKSLVGEVEPLIQVHTTTTETISLQEVRSSDSSSEKGKHKEDDLDSDSSECAPVMVVQERITDKTGWRLVQIRPALYEKHEEYSTPS
ncbi:hypothetical protein MPSEU_000374400 [Mayamaea pseudoterrestris]|nr:hypothetical protein MPSEU_000374400 [Mayamaea pseudoterrestris]